MPSGNHILLFWIAFIFTHPFGATFGDLLTKPLEKGGMIFFRGAASVVTLGLLVLALVISTMSAARTRFSLEPWRKIG
ncbi:hypothetical protein LRX75_20865 [Rhizobium sp. DKSPLA3]|uniref:Uncharacterized protein n=1 Tax=Rhizobium quercicola TaxID=2901226 RepID=A0A9X1T273_9HYPH|nr:hypothetical protein [Rhizobium quercicola]MCD7111491.1 hypothetical protein [Rhizobium quercicola]